MKPYEQNDQYPSFGEQPYDWYNKDFEKLDNQLEQLKKEI